MVEHKRRARRKPAPTLTPSYASPVAFLALGMLGGYAAMVLLPAAGATDAPLWQVAFGAALVTLLALVLALRNCVPFSSTPLRGRLVAGFCLLGFVATGVFTYRTYIRETEPTRRPTATEAPAGAQPTARPTTPVDRAPRL